MLYTVKVDFVEQELVSSETPLYIACDVCHRPSLCALFVTNNELSWTPRWRYSPTGVASLDVIEPVLTRRRRERLHCLACWPWVERCTRPRWLNGWARL